MSYFYFIFGITGVALAISAHAKVERLEKALLARGVLSKTDSVHRR